MEEIPRHYQGLEYAVAPFDGIASEAYVYGSHSLQVCDLRMPEPGAVRGIVALIHGGGWHAPWDRRQFNGVASALTRAGWMTWNIDHRAIGDRGDHDTILADVLAAMIKLREVALVNRWDVPHCIVAGHSAGAHLAFWVAAEMRQTAAIARAPGLLPTAAVSLAGILDLREAMTHTGIAGMTAAFMGGTPAEQPRRFAATSPAERLPLGIPQLIVGGTLDDVVPASQTSSYVTAAQRAGDPVTAWSLPVGHMAYLNPRAPVWSDVRRWMEDVTRAR